jgi:hypothetical protein
MPCFFTSLPFSDPDLNKPGKEQVHLQSKITLCFLIRMVPYKIKHYYFNTLYQTLSEIFKLIGIKLSVIFITYKYR